MANGLYVGNGSVALGNMTKVGVGYGAGYRDIQRIYVGDGAVAHLVWQAFNVPPDIFDTEGPYSVNIPAGAARVVITIIAEGGEGGFWDTDAGGGGGAPGNVQVEYTLAAADWGQALSGQVGGTTSYNGSDVNGTLTNWGAITGTSTAGGNGDDGTTGGAGGIGQGGGVNTGPNTIYTGNNGAAGGSGGAGGAATGPNASTYGHGGSGQLTSGGSRNVGRTGGLVRFDWFGS